jgi:acylphosphatase
VNGARYVVRGRVQGVMFRANAAEVARRLGIDGRIWNRDDGAVEAIAEGEPAALEEFERWLRVGPRHARVEGVDVQPLSGEPRHHGFAVD